MLKIIYWIPFSLFIVGIYFFSRRFSFLTIPYREPITPINCSQFGFGNQSWNDIPIYDFFILNNELDMLEVHLYELYDYVNLFLIAESNRTLSGKIKPFYLKNNWARFSRYSNKIRRVEVSLLNLINTTKTAWDNEARMRDEGIRLALPNTTKDFLLLTSDIDEIPKARFIRALRSCQLPPVFPPTLLQCDFYYYSFEYIQPSSPLWPGGTLSRFNSSANVPSGLRSSRHSYRPIRGGCFHCSYCFDSIALVRSKLSSFSHTETNIDRFRNLKHIVDRFRHGKDLFDNLHQPFERSKLNETELPRLFQIPGERERFMYMFNRSSMANIGFRDYDHINMTIV